MEVAALVAQGLTNREIATHLYLSERTVDGHLEHLREKLGVSNRAQITAWYVRQGGAEAVTSAPISAPATRPQTRLVAHPRLWLAVALVLGLLVAGVGVVQLLAPPPLQVTTVAGSECHHQAYPGGCFNGDGIDQATHAYLARPTDVVVDGSGVIYIADYGNFRLRQVVTGNISTVAGKDPNDPQPVPPAPGVLATSASLADVSSVAVDVDGRPIFFTASDDGSLAVWKVNGDGFLEMKVQLPLPSGTGGPIGPNMPAGGLAVAKDGTLFIADRNGNQVWKFAGGKLETYAGTGDFGFSENGAATSSELAWPIGLALDPAGDLLIADAGNNRIRMVDPHGRITTIAGSGTDGDGGDRGRATDAQLRFPYGVAVGPDGSIVVSDTGNHRLRLILGGQINALAGTGQWGFNSDGPALQTMLSGPEGIAFDSNGDLFIADTENQRIREIKSAVRK
jgi:DNA-binding CsgD family transcriptional regulator/sugar lactone lactonase YvrE